MERPQDYLGQRCIAFEKLDGSNVRFEWSGKQGWYKFGTRKTMIGHDSYFKQAKSLILATDDLIPKILDYPKFPFVAFFEFLGDGSFAGFHIDDPKRIILLDVSIYKKGILSPFDFIKKFNTLIPIPKIIFDGHLTQNFVDNVKHNKIGSFEGAVIKGIDNNRVWMTKIKSDAWINAVRVKGFLED